VVAAFIKVKWFFGSLHEVGVDLFSVSGLTPTPLQRRGASSCGFALEKYYDGHFIFLEWEVLKIEEYKFNSFFSGRFLDGGEAPLLWRGIGVRLDGGF